MTAPSSFDLLLFRLFVIGGGRAGGSFFVTRVRLSKKKTKCVNLIETCLAIDDDNFPSTAVVKFFFRFHDFLLAF